MIFNMQLRRFCCLAALSLIAFLPCCLAALAKSSKWHKEFSTDIKELENYLNSLTTLEADFVQSVGKIRRRHSRGKFYLQRSTSQVPNSTNNFSKKGNRNRSASYRKPKIHSALCIDYQYGGTKAKIVAKNGIATFYDKELEELSKMDIKDSPVAILLKPKISFAEMHITNISRRYDEITIDCCFDEEHQDMVFIMVFSLMPVSIKQMSTVMDGQKDRITLTFSNIVLGARIKDSVFSSRSAPIAK